MSGADGIAVALYRGSSSEIVPLADYVAMWVAARRRVRADLDAVTVSVVIGGEERLAHAISLGPLARLVPQLEPARERLLAGEPALIRSGVMDVPAGHYLLFEPSPGGAEVLLSAVSLADPETGVWFPDGDRAPALYAYVTSHRDTLVAAARRAPGALVEAPLDRAALLDALARDARAGRALLDAR